MAKKGKLANADTKRLEHICALVCQALEKSLEDGIHEMSRDNSGFSYPEKPINAALKFLQINDFKVKDEVLEGMSERAKELQELRKKQGSALKVVGE